MRCFQALPCLTNRLSSFPSWLVRKFIFRQCLEFVCFLSLLFEVIYSSRQPIYLFWPDVCILCRSEFEWSFLKFFRSIRSLLVHFLRFQGHGLQLIHVNLQSESLAHNMAAQRMLFRQIYLFKKPAMLMMLHLY